MNKILYSKILAWLDKTCQIQDKTLSDAERLEESIFNKAIILTTFFAMLIHTISFFTIEAYPSDVFITVLMFFPLGFLITIKYANKRNTLSKQLLGLAFVAYLPLLFVDQSKIALWIVTCTLMSPYIAIILTRNIIFVFICFFMGLMCSNFQYNYIFIETALNLPHDQLEKYLDGQTKLLNVTFMVQLMLALALYIVMKTTQNELARALEAKELFIASFSHELRNPLNSLNGNVEFALMENKDHSVNELLQNMKICSETILQMINNILDSAKADLGHIEISKDRTILKDIANKVWIISKETIRKKGLISRLNFDKAIPRALMLDSHRITQVMLNLIGNAVKFTEKGGVFLSFTWLEREKIDEGCFIPTPYQDDYEGVLEKEDAISSTKSSFVDTIRTMRSLSGEFSPAEVNSKPTGKGIIKIIIRDTGIGISLENMGKVFQKYSQICGKSKSKQGTGLGLWISKVIIDEMGGEIRVYSKEGIGTTFIICLKADGINE